MSKSLEVIGKLLDSAVDAATAGDVVSVETGTRYGGASAHFAMALSQKYIEDMKVRDAIVAAIDGISSMDAVEAVKAMKLFVKQSRLFVNPSRFESPNGVPDASAIFLATHFARVATEEFDATELSAYAACVHRLNWLVVTALELYSRGSFTVATLLRRIDNDSRTDFKLPDRIEYRLQQSGRSLFPTPAAITAAVGVGKSCKKLSFPLGYQNAINFVRGINTALWDLNTTVERPSGASTQALFLRHILLFLGNDVSQRLECGLFPCDRMPMVAPWYASFVLAIRAYAALVCYVLTTRTPCETPVSSNSALTKFVLLSLASGCDSIVHPCSSLFDAPTKSMYTPMNNQDPRWWVLLRAALSGMTDEDSLDVARHMVGLSQRHEIKLQIRTIVALCAMMHTRSGMLIFGMMSDPTSDPNDIASYPLASLVMDWTDPVLGQNVLQLLTNFNSGSCDYEFLATHDIAFTNIDAQERAWTREFDIRRMDESKPVPEPTFSLEADPVVGVFTGAIHAIAVKWLDRLRTIGEFPGRVEKSEAERTLQVVSSSTGLLHCAPWVRNAFKIARGLELVYMARGDASLISVPLPKGVDGLEEAAWMRLNLRQQTENVLHASRRACHWSTSNKIVVVAWLATEGSVSPLTTFARILRGHDAEDATQLLKNGWRSRVSESGDDAVVCCALEFERSLQRAIQSSCIRPRISDGSVFRSTVEAILSDYKRFELPCIDEASKATVSLVTDATANSKHAEKTYVFRQPFSHGCVVSLVSIPSVAPRAQEGRLVPLRWSDGEELIRALTMFEKGTDPTLRA
jgi:hypothetical protein